MIQLSHFSIGFGGNLLLDGIDTVFPAACLSALIGRNGSGKSTLLRAVAGLDSHYTGSIIVGGRDRRSLSAPEAARLIAFVTTRRPRIANLSCRDLVAIGRAPYTDWIGRLTPRDRDIVDSALADVGMSGFADRTLDSMSDGECQRIMIARALAQDTAVILLDEPTSFLDLPNRYELVSLLQSLAHRRSKTILFSTHELDIALALADRIALIDTPRLINLPVADMLDAGHISRLFPIPVIPR